MTLALWQNIPFVCVLLPLLAAAVCSALPQRAAKAVTGLILLLLTGLSAFFLIRMAALGDSYTYMMGHFPAPWGNELRAGPLEALVGLAFALVLLLSYLGGVGRWERHILPDRHHMVCVLLMLLAAALQTLVYTNDIFTAYVFVEIMTIAAAALIAAHTRGRTLVAAARYMIMNLIGSALFLLSIILLYDLTGHLLMSPIQRQVAQLAETGGYHLPLTVVIALMTVGLAVKSALFPFHTWVPDAYSAATPTAAAALSSLVSKAYIFLLIKLIVRIIGEAAFTASHVNEVLVILGLAAMLMGSVDALRQTDIRRMTAYSSVAQIGYIYVGVGLGGEAGLTAALMQLLAHTAAKALLFLAIPPLTDAAGGAKQLRDMEGTAYRAPLAGAAFTAGALSIVGVPLLGGFPAKLALAQAAIGTGSPAMWLVLLMLALSTAMNAAYFFRAVIALWRKKKVMPDHTPVPRAGFCWHVTILLLMLLCLALGLCAPALLTLIRGGVSLL